jgi:hypothetical protein
LLVRGARGIETVSAIELPGAQYECPVLRGKHVLCGVTRQDGGRIFLARFWILTGCRRKDERDEREYDRD